MRARSRAAATLVFLLLLGSTLAAEKPKDQQKHYGLIFGTAYGPDDRVLYGVKVEIHPAGKRHPRWELVSDHRGEFAQRVPPGPADYVVTGTIEIKDAQTNEKKRLKAEAKVHIEAEERRDIGLHLSQ